MKSLKESIYNKRDAKKQTSEKRGNLGTILAIHSNELNKLKTHDEILKFLDNIYTELNPFAKEYVDFTVKPELMKMKNNFIKSYSYLYRIHLAGFSDSRIGK